MTDSVTLLIQLVSGSNLSSSKTPVKSGVLLCWLLNVPATCWCISDNFTCCHTETEVADQTFYLTQSQYTDTGPTSPSTDPTTPGAWQGSHWSANFWVTGMTRPRKNPGASGIRTRDLPLSTRVGYRFELGSALFNSLSPMPHHTTLAVWVSSEGHTRLIVLCLNTSLSKREFTFHPLSTVRNTFNKLNFKTKLSQFLFSPYMNWFSIWNCHHWHRRVKSINILWITFPVL